MILITALFLAGLFLLAIDHLDEGFGGLGSLRNASLLFVRELFVGGMWVGVILLELIGASLFGMGVGTSLFGVGVGVKPSSF